MNKFWKFIITLTSVLFLLWGGFALVKAGFTNYFEHASFITSGLIVILGIIVIYLFYKGMKMLWSLPLVLLLILPLMQSCNYAKSNQQVVVSKDCGVTWELIKAGESVPKGVANPCYMKVVMPNYPMQGECKFITNLKERVRAQTEIDYDYTISGPLEFIKQAKYLGKANSDADDEVNNSSNFEMAENMVIDKRLKDVSKNLFLSEDIVELDQSELENKLLEESNKVLEPLGIHLNFITLTFDLDEQTRQAIDVATAMKVYESKNLTEIVKMVIVARSGAPRIGIENKTIPPTESK